MTSSIANYRTKVKILVTLVIIMASALMFALGSRPPAPTRSVSPDLIIFVQANNEPTSRSIFVTSNGKTHVMEVSNG